MTTEQPESVFTPKVSNQTHQVRSTNNTKVTDSNIPFKVIDILDFLIYSLSAKELHSAKG